MTRLMNDLTTQKTKLQSENGMCMFCPDSVSQEFIRAPLYCISEMCSAMASALKVAGLGLLSRAVALCLLTFLSSVFL